MIRLKTFVLVGSAALALLASPSLAQPLEAVRTAPSTIEVRWTGIAAADIYRTDRADMSIKDAALVSSDDRDGHEVVTLPKGTRGLFLVRDRATGKVTQVAERSIPLEQGSNFRDIGGYPAAHGKTVRWGQIYRSGGTPLLSDADLGTIAALRLSAMVDLRSDEERQLAPTRIGGVPYLAVGYSMKSLLPSGSVPRNGGAVYRAMPKLLAPHLRLVFEHLGRNEGPIEYNCSAGQDRTGFVTAMVLTALGTPRATIVEDYHLSTALRRPEFEMTAFDPAAFPDNMAAKMFSAYRNDPVLRTPQPLVEADGTPYLLAAFDEIETKWGSVDAYLQKEVGVTPADISRLRKIYTR